MDSKEEEEGRKNGIHSNLMFHSRRRSGKRASIFFFFFFSFQFVSIKEIVSRCCAFDSILNDREEKRAYLDR